MHLVLELKNEDTKRNKFQVFKNVSFDPRAIPVIPAYFGVTRNKRLSLLKLLNFFYLIMLIFKESLFLAIGNTPEVHFQGCGKYF